MPLGGTKFCTTKRYPMVAQNFISPRNIPYHHGASIGGTTFCITKDAPCWYKIVYHQGTSLGGTKFCTTK
eukprot:8896533-Ditylum_brightwellii.AAC.1